MGVAVTINIERKVAEEFKEVAMAVYGRRKGSLGKAVSEALGEWVKGHKSRNADVAGLELLRQGFAMGKLNYSKRSELHER